MIGRRAFLAKAAAIAGMPFVAAGQRILPQADKAIKWEEMATTTIYRQWVNRGGNLTQAGWNISPQIASRASQVQVAGYSIWDNGVQSAVTKWNGSLSALMDRLPFAAEKAGSIVVYFHP